MPRWSGVFVVGVTSRLEVLHPEASWSRASSALRVRDCWSCALLFFCFCVGKRGKRVCVCKNVDVQEAQREAFPFTVAAYRMRKSPECTRRAHSSASSPRKLHEGNTCFCKQAPCDTDHPSSGEVFALISSSLLIYFFFTIILPIATLLTFPQPNLAG